MYLTQSTCGSYPHIDELLNASFVGTMMIINEMEKQKITPTEVRFIMKEMKGV